MSTRWEITLDDGRVTGAIAPTEELAKNQAIAYETERIRIADRRGYPADRVPPVSHPVEFRRVKE